MIDKQELFKLKSLGLNIIPVGEDKVASIRWKKFQDTKITDSEILHHDFKGVAFVCGLISKIVVVDCDTQYSIEWLESQKWFEPTPVIVKTRKGRHYYYRTGKKIVATRRFERGENLKIDLKAERGIALCPPTTNYRWLAFTDDFDSIPEIPEKYIDVLRPKKNEGDHQLLPVGDVESREIQDAKIREDLEKVLGLFSPPLRVNEKRNIYVRQAVELLKSLGLKVDHSKTGPMNSDKFHINGFAVMDGRKLGFYAASTGSFFFSLPIPVEYQIKLHEANRK